MSVMWVLTLFVAIGALSFCFTFPPKNRWPYLSKAASQLSELSQCKKKLASSPGLPLPFPDIMREFDLPHYSERGRPGNEAKKKLKHSRMCGRWCTANHKLQKLSPVKAEDL